MIQVDRVATAARRFEDDRSKILKDGREICYGEDWKQRRSELLARCGGRCEQIVSKEGKFGPELRCRADAEDPHHLEKRSVKRDDRLANLQALCRFHHDLLDQRKPRWTRREAILEGEGR